MATAGVIFALSLSYGVVAVVGYIINFNKNTFRVHRGESNLFFSLAQWQDDKLTISIPSDLELNIPTLALIYDDHGNILWRERYIAELELHIEKNWLKKSGFYELNPGKKISSTILGDNSKAQNKLKKYTDVDIDALTHSVSVNIYPATSKLPRLTIVVVDVIPQELQRSDLVWNWFSYVLLANLFLVVPLLWLAAYWSLRPIKALVSQISQLEKGEREQLDENPPQELFSLVRNLKIFC